MINYISIQELVLMIQDWHMKDKTNWVVILATLITQNSITKFYRLLNRWSNQGKDNMSGWSMTSPCTTNEDWGINQQDGNHNTDPQPHARVQPGSTN